MTSGQAVGEGRADERFVAPTPATAVAPRAPVVDRLSRANGKVAVVRAPAGYGKTTQVAQWVVLDGRPFAWIDLQRSDNDPAAMLKLLTDALARVAGIDAGEISGTASSLQWATVVAPLLGRAVGRCLEPFVLVLDDVHRVDRLEAIDLLEALVSNVPALSTVVLVGRGVPEVPLARVREQAGAVEVTATELALDVVGARHVLDHLDVEADDEWLARIVADTEGWPVGIRLAALARRESDDAAAERVANPGAQRLMDDYVHEEWLRGNSAEDIDFLMRVSGLEPLDGSLCDWALERSDSGERLDRLHRSRSIVVPLARRGETYRLHGLLRRVLDAQFERVDRSGRAAVDLRASEWFEVHSDVDRAVCHAQRARDVARAERLVHRYAAEYTTTGRYMTVCDWIESFDRGHVLGSALLCFAASAAAIGGGDGETASAWIRRAEVAQARRQGDCEPTEIDLEIAMIRALLSVGSVADALADAERAYRGLPAGVSRVVACMVLGANCFAAGDVERAVAVLSEGAAEAAIVGAVSTEANIRAHLAIAHEAAGNVDRAAACARHARELIRSHRLEGMPTTTLATAVGALVEAADGNPEVARADVQLTRRNLAFNGSVAACHNVQARIALARACLLLGDRVAARILVEEAELYLTSQPDAVRPREQIAALDGRLRAARATLPVGPSSLTTAELRVLHYLPTNLSIKEIAQRLFVSRNTAKSHAAAVYRKLGVASRSEAVTTARAAGLLDGAAKA